MKIKAVLATLTVLALSTPAIAAHSDHDSGQRGDRVGHSQVQRSGSAPRTTSYRDYRANRNNFRSNNRSSDYVYSRQYGYRSYGDSGNRSEDDGY